MRNVVLSLIEHFKNNNVSKITNYVQTQYNRVVLCGNTPISLHDAKESEIIVSLKELFSEVDISLNDLLNSVMIVPAIDKVTNRLTVVIELNKSFYRNLINSCPNAAVKEDFILYSSDIYQLSGNDAHITYRRKGDEGEVLAACINFNLGSNKASCGLSQSELKNIKKLYIDVKYGGIDPFTESEWHDLFITSTYRRAIDDDALFRAESILGKQVTANYKAAIQIHNAFFTKQELAERLIKNDYGRVVGEIKTLFSPTELINQKNLTRNGNYVIKRSRKPEDVSLNVSEELDPFDLSGCNLIEQNHTIEQLPSTETQISQEEYDAAEMHSELVVEDFFS